MSIFKEGHHLNAVFFPNEVSHQVGITCKSITVSMENGQMAEVPWFEIVDNNDVITLWNAALVEGVEL